MHNATEFQQIFQNPKAKRQSFPAKIAETESVITFVTSVLPEGIDDFVLDMMVEEIFVNIASYAYPDGPGKAKVYCAHREEDDAVIVCFIDGGIPFDPLKKETAKVSGAVEDIAIGGLGILMVKKYAATLEYRRENGENQLLFIKTLKR